MKFEVEIVSKVIIKPSSPTPDHLRHYQLSFIDQISPLVYCPLVLFYASNDNNEFNRLQISNHLKLSLSESLTHFYPLAGRLKNTLDIDCNDEGIPFSESLVKCQLSEAIQNPIPNELVKLLPFGPVDVTELVSGVQVNVFECGGIAIGVCISHKIGDALSLFMFINSWAEISCGQKDRVHPLFVSTKLFPPQNTSVFYQNHDIMRNDIITKRFLFNSSAIKSLQEKYSDVTNLKYKKHPSRIEALSAFIWTRFAASTAIESQNDKIYVVIHTVNARSRIDPPLPRETFGNLYWLAITVPSAKEEPSSLMTNIRDQISKIDKEYLRKLQDGEHLEFLGKCLEGFCEGKMVTFSFSSLCRFPIYEADFGWGNPTWVGSPALSLKNLVVFMDAKLNDGIEAYISLRDDDMVKFEADKEFLPFVSSNGC